MKSKSTRIMKLTVRAARAQKRLTQDAMAQKLEITIKTYIGWENGDIDLKAFHMFAIAGALDMDVDELEFP